MVKFVYRHNGDNRYISPYTKMEHLFIGDNPTEIEDERDIALMRTSDAFIEVDKPKKVSKQKEEVIEKPHKKVEPIEKVRKDPMKIGTKLKK